MSRPSLSPRGNIYLLLTLSAWVVAGHAQTPALTYSRFFTTQTMRVDFSHRGGPGGESLALEQVVSEDEWPGSRSWLIDDTNLGQYLFQVVDQRTRQTIFSRGFGSIYGEWQTTAEFRATDRTFHESLRFPRPKRPVHVIVKQRDARNTFQDLWAVDVDPARTTSHVGRKAAVKAWTVFASGAARAKVDLLLVSSGYTAAQIPKFHADAARMTEMLFSYEPFKSRRHAFNVRALDLPAETSHVKTEYNVFGLQRYVLTYDNQALRDAVAATPYDVLQILVNDKQYGGGGIFNLQSTAAVDNERAEYVFVHELAHNFAGLGDEYVGNVTYESTSQTLQAEPWEPNLTALLDARALKWRDLVDPETPLPTPSTFAGKVGAFEGGRYEAHGIYRSEFECLMGSAKVGITFCRVCQRAITRIIDRLTS